MNKNKIILLALLSVACSKGKEQKTLISELEKTDYDQKIVERSLASAPRKCLKDIFSVDTLKAEINELEKKHASGTKVSGSWKHLRLADLPIPQANFLKTYGDLMGDLNDPNAIDYTGCSDVPCLFNRIYGKENHVAGYVHYLWYLKYNYLLAATNKVYDSKSQTKPGIYNGKTFPLSAYLYRDKELYAFWRLSLMAKVPYTSLSHMKEMYRVPQGESFDFEVEERNQIREENIRRRAQGQTELPMPWGETCGLAYSNGYIIMQDMCLSLYADQESGNFYESVLHEMTHQLDYSEGRKLRKTYRSSEDDYLTVADFYLDERKDESGRTVRQWEHKPGIKLVSSYAGTSPAENYAETIAFYRVDGTDTKFKIKNDHWNFVQNNYYPGKSFDKVSLIKGWVNANSSQISSFAFKTVGDCSKNSAGAASTYFTKTDFVTPMTTSMLACLGAKAAEFSREIQWSIKATEPDGCSTLSDANIKSDWEPLLKIQLKDKIAKYIQELQADKAYFARIQEFHDQIPDRTMSNKAFLECYGSDDEASCYEDQVLKLALLKLAPLDLPEENANELASLYFKAHPIGDTRTHLMSYYKAFVTSNRELTEKAATDLFESCSQAINDDAPPSGRLFTLSEGYLASSIYNCINAQFPDTAKTVVRDLAVNGVKVQHAKEEEILLEQVLPELQKSLQDIYLGKKVDESKHIKAFAMGDQGSLRSQLISDFSWVKDVVNSASITRDCEKLALSKIPFKPAYHQKSEAFGELITSSCAGIQETPEFNTWLENSRSSFADGSVDGLEKKIFELAVEEAKGCVKLYPVDSQVNRLKFKSQRDSCLLGKWEGIEASAIKEFEKDPVVIRLKIKTDEVVAQLAVNRRRLQLRVMKEQF